MTKEEKLEELAEILEEDAADLSEDMSLEEFDTWDSIAVLSIISLMNEKFNKYPHASEIRDLKTVGDVLEFIS